MIIRVGSVAAVALLIAMAVVPASAHNPAGTADDPHLEKFVSPPADGNATALIGFHDVAGGDAPGSAQPKALRIETEANTMAVPSFAGATLRKTGVTGTALADVNRISFKTKGFSGAGAPRLSMELRNGRTAFLASFHCSFEMTPSPWDKADFTASPGTDPSCSIFMSAGPPYTTDPTTSAWEKLVAGEGPGIEIQRLQLVQDEGPAVVWVDDIRFNGIVFSGPNVDTHSH